MLRLCEPATVNRDVLQLILGPLEAQIMEVLWGACDECSVREVIERLHRDVAYTTVMTTLDRLFRKGLASRCMRGRTYFYSPRVTCEEWTDKVARDVVAKLLAGPKGSREILIACLLEAASQQDGSLLHELERTIRERMSHLA